METANFPLTSRSPHAFHCVLQYVDAVTGSPDNAHGRNDCIQDAASTSAGRGEFECDVAGDSAHAGEGRDADEEQTGCEEREVAGTR